MLLISDIQLDITSCWSVCFHFTPLYKHSTHLSLALHVHYLVKLTHHMWSKQPQALLWHMDLVNDTRSFHTTRNIHGITPNIIQHLPDSNYSGGHRAIVEPNTHSESESIYLPIHCPVSNLDAV